MTDNAGVQKHILDLPTEVLALIMDEVALLPVEQKQGDDGTTEASIPIVRAQRTCKRFLELARSALFNNSDFLLSLGRYGEENPHTENGLAYYLGHDSVEDAQLEASAPHFWLPDAFWDRVKRLVLAPDKSMDGIFAIDRIQILSRGMEIEMLNQSTWMSWRYAIQHITLDAGVARVIACQNSDTHYSGAEVATVNDLKRYARMLLKCFSKTRTVTVTRQPVPFDLRVVEIYTFFELLVRLGLDPDDIEEVELEVREHLIDFEHTKENSLKKDKGAENKEFSSHDLEAISEFRQDRVQARRKVERGLKEHDELILSIMRKQITANKKTGVKLSAEVDDSA